MSESQSFIDVDRIETPERVELSADLAGIGSRGLAVLLDSLLLMLCAIGLALVLIPLVFVQRTLGVVIAIVAMFLLQWLYFALFEGLRDGQTPGKKALGLRVRKAGGFPIGWPEALIRNFLRVVDGFGLYAVGVALPLATSRVFLLASHARASVILLDGYHSSSDLSFHRDSSCSKVVSQMHSICTSLLASEEDLPHL